MGVVLPAYIIILGTVIALRPYLESYVAKAVFRGINAAVVALILYAFLRLARTALLVKDTLAVDVVPLAVFLLSLVLLIALKMHPIIVIGVAAIIGLATGLLNK
jgi:chromate transporter